LFAQDNDGMYFVDYLGINLMETERDWARRLREIETFVRDELAEVEDLRIRQKISWLDSYIQQAKLSARSKKNTFATRKGG
jgi:hypothetical protein